MSSALHESQELLLVLSAILWHVVDITRFTDITNLLKSPRSYLSQPVASRYGLYVRLWAEAQTLKFKFVSQLRPHQQ